MNTFPTKGKRNQERWNSSFESVMRYTLRAGPVALFVIGLAAGALAWCLHPGRRSADRRPHGRCPGQCPRAERPPGRTPGDRAAGETARQIPGVEHVYSSSATGQASVTLAGTWAGIARTQFSTPITSCTQSRPYSAGGERLGGQADRGGRRADSGAGAVEHRPATLQRF